VQQLDNEVLAPLVYGRATQLHPLVALLAVAIGGALFGVAGSFLAVPVTAVTASVLREVRRASGEQAGGSITNPS
jgi:putative heme transporter